MPIATLKELRSRDFDYWCALHLANRAGFGGSPHDVRELHKMGLGAAVDHYVDYQKQPGEPVAADLFDSTIIGPPSVRERMMIQQARRAGDADVLERLQQERQQRQMTDRQQLRQMQRWWMRRMIETPRPLEEKMTLFWHGHFAASYRGVDDSYHMFVQNQFFRAHAAGNFADLVFGIIRDPAMLKYLNNDQNRRASPNENFARELMELFTLGEGIGYTEQDIKEGARALTGYTFDDDSFVFNAEMHDRGPKIIFGQRGRWNGDDFCRLILRQRGCSEFICWKLYRYFVNDLPGKPDEPTRTFITRLARVMREHDYEIKPVLKALFRSEHFYHRVNRASVIKSPMQLAAQAVRSLRTPLRGINVIVNAADLMGQHLFMPPSVKGWDGGRSWINTSSLFARQNLMLYLLTGQRVDPEERENDRAAFDPQHVLEDLREIAEASETSEVVTALLRFTLGDQPHPQRVGTIMNFLEENGRQLNRRTLIGALALIGAMPEYQLC